SSAARSRTTAGCAPPAAARSPGSAAARAPRPPSALPGAEARVLLAAVELPVGLARLRARQVHAAARAAHEIADFRRAGLWSLAGAPRAQGPAHQPDGEHDQQDQHEELAHRAII